MLINEIVQYKFLTTESVGEELAANMKDLLGMYKAEGIDEIDTEKFCQRLKNVYGHDEPLEVITMALQDIGEETEWISSATEQSIKIDTEIETDTEQPTVDVGDLAQDAAMKGIKSEL